MYKILISLFIGTISMVASASTIVMLNGITSSNTWDSTKISSNLSRFHNVKVIQLPYRESLQFQSAYLNKMLKQIDDDIYLVGHSAGGVVARNVFVRSDNKNIKSLITIASPHLGSDLALYGSILNDKIPFGNLFSKIVLPDEASAHMPLRQLKEKSAFLADLNNLKHPNGCYVSIVKTGGYINNSFASTKSQNMNNIFGLIASGNVSAPLFSNTGHKLHPTDVALIDKSITACTILNSKNEG
jgi:pimeloyl-ACP methyl ester carboxylesterase